MVDCCGPKVLRDTLPVFLKESASQSDLYLWALYCKTFTDLSSISAPVDPTCRCVELLSKQVLVLSSNPLWGLRDSLFSEVFTCVCVEFLNESQTQKQLLQRDISMSDSTLKTDQPQNPDVMVKSWSLHHNHLLCGNTSDLGPVIINKMSHAQKIVETKLFATQNNTADISAALTTGGKQCICQPRGHQSGSPTNHSWLKLRQWRNWECMRIIIWLCVQFMI